MNVIGLSGTAGAGKDSFADRLCSHHGFVRVGFADPMKRFCEEVFGFSDRQVWGNIDDKNRPDRRYRRADGSPLTPRYALQTLGTEWGRNCYPDLWIDYALRVAEGLLGTGWAYTPRTGIYEDEGARIAGVVFTDCRFANEVDAVRRAGGRVIRIVRPGFDGMKTIAAHVSEAGQAEMPDSVFDAVVWNCGTLAELHRAADEIAGIARAA